MSIPDFRADCARQLTSLIERASAFTAFIGLDGFVDEIIRAVEEGKISVSAAAKQAKPQPSPNQSRIRKSPSAGRSC